MENGFLKKTWIIGIVLLFLSLNFASNVAGQVVESKPLDTVIQQLMKRGHIPSLASGIIKNNNMTCFYYGYADIENSSSPTNDTVYLIGSISKVVIATAILQLYEKDLLDIDGDVNQYLDFSLRNPWHRNTPISVRMLLTHKASLAYEDEKSFYQVYYDQDPPEISSWLEAYFYNTDGSPRYDKWLYRWPGTGKAHYSNLGFTVLGRVVEVVSHQSLNEYCQDHIFGPLHMNHSTFLLSETTGETMAKPYVFIDDQPVIYYLPLPFYSVRFYPAGGLWTTVEDLSHFLLAHMNGGQYRDTRILNESTVTMMHNQYLGWWSHMGKLILGRPVLNLEGHGGGIYGYTSWMFDQKNQHIGYIFFTNRYLGLDAEAECCLKLIMNLLVLRAHSKDVKFL